MITDSAPSVSSQDVINFWFSDAVRRKWWAKDNAFDREIRTHFAATLEQAKRGELSCWHASAEGRLAEIIVLDQFSRNLFRDSGRAFEQDELARQRVRDAVACGADRELSSVQRSFLYMPMMHSESPADHEEAVKLFSSDPDLESNLEFELKHKAIIDRFGRYPHRNAMLGRDSTAQELSFLTQPGSSF